MIVVSHRGPISFREQADGSFEQRRGSGGVVSALAPLLARREDAHWIAAAISEDDRTAVAAGESHADEFNLRLLSLDPDAHRAHYDTISNSTFWFLFHGLFDLSRFPRFDRHWRDAWQSYVEVNKAFADAVAETAAGGDVVLIQDLHLMLVAGMLKKARPDLHVSHFTHTPFCGPNSIRVLPDYAAHAVCSSLATCPSGFHAQRWADAFRASSQTVLGAHAAVGNNYAASFGPDPKMLESELAMPEVQAAIHSLEERVGDRALVVRSDRVEPSKNIVRGFYAYDLLLEEHPELRERVVFAALLNPSRDSIPAYQAYRDEVEQAAARVNDRWARDDWQPVLLDTRDDYARSIAGLARSDVLLVNPVRDGLNLVAMEGPLVNDRDGVVCLSRDAGAFDILEQGCLAVNPYDIVQTAAVLHEALEMEPAERASRAAILRDRAASSPPSLWLETQIRHARN
ncbi:MAG: trehalose-6-phosphate synthase [Acidimicrobiia bacterium]|nr:trehalose-6-phosphate synthase [Acidimicrobiia bacterium]